MTRPSSRKVLEDSAAPVSLWTNRNTGGWRNFFSPIPAPGAAPEWTSGLKDLPHSLVADIPQVLVEALGASPTPIPWPELFTSIQTGVVEGTKNGITDIMNMKFPEAGLQYLTLDGHAYMAALWFMNNEKLMAMPEDLRRVVADGFYQLQQATFASPKRKSIQAYEDFLAGGGDIYVPSVEDQAAFAQAAAPVYDWFIENVDGGEDVLNTLQESVAEAEAKLEAARMAIVQ